MPVLEGNGVTKHFGGLAAVSNVDFSVEEGEAFGLIGPNGAGKTTLFNLISAAHPVKSGTIKFKGSNITGLKPYKICRMGIARTFQTVKIFPNLSVLNNVILGLHFGCTNKTTSLEKIKKAVEYLDFVGLSNVKSVSAKDITLANQKKLEIARALATSPELLLLDEIMAGLNPTEVAEAMELVNQIREQGITIIMIEHVMKAIMNVCQRIMVLHHGEKIAEGTPQEVATSEKVIKVYLGDKTHAAG